MKCPICQTEYDPPQQFCRNCGANLRQACPLCHSRIFLGDRFCGSCGSKLHRADADRHRELSPERKYVTVLFADVSGYTAMSENLDAEEVKDTMSHLFGEIAKVVVRFGGFIEEFAGDSVMVVFGAPRTHEDDPIRAIRAAQEIHQVVEAVGKTVEAKYGHSLGLHIGINTGLVVTGKIHIGNGLPHVAGDSINVAARLCSLAGPHEILVGQATYEQAEGFFIFERLEPMQVKGRSKPVQVYKVLDSQTDPCKLHRSSGRQATLVGREREMAELHYRCHDLFQGQGAIVAITGEAGTGKSRLLREFRATLDHTAIHWHEGHAFAYTQNVPYSLFINLLKRVFKIKEGDPPERVKDKVVKKIQALLRDERSLLPYLGELLAISNPETLTLDIDALKSGLRHAVLTVLSALARQGPTLFCLEDLHWADSESLELLKYLWNRLNYPALFLCSHRPPLHLVRDHLPSTLQEAFYEIELHDLTPTEVQQMVASLLRTEEIPKNLEQFLAEKVEGNPFYVEEMVNSLLEANLLSWEYGTWCFRQPGRDLVLPATVHGLISARVDRLDSVTKQILQEASVIGRVFCEDILAAATVISQNPEPYLQVLRDLGILIVETTHPDKMYSFRHAIFQETIYKSLLKKNRRDIHERVGLALEKFFQDRSLEAWETLAFHFQRGHSVDKAVLYLVRSGERGLKKYALDAAEQYYREAYHLLTHSLPRSRDQDVSLIDLIMKWCLVLYYQGRFKEMRQLLIEHLPILETMGNQEKLGLYYAWLGHASFWHGASLEDAYRYLHQALVLGEKSGSSQVTAYAIGFLIKVCAELGYMVEAQAMAERCRSMMDTLPDDYFLKMIYYSGRGYIGWFAGDRTMLQEAGRGILAYGQETSSVRCQMVGLLILGFWHFLGQETGPALACVQEVIDRGDPYHSVFARLVMGMMLVQLREPDAALTQLQHVFRYSEQHGTEYMKTFANVFRGMALAARGQLAAGLQCLQDSRRDFQQCQRRVFHGLTETILGTVYLMLYLRAGPRRLSLLWANRGVILKNLFSAGRKAEVHLQQGATLARECGSRGFLGQPYLQLGVLWKARGKRDQAQAYLQEALRIFQDCGMVAYAQRAQELLAAVAQPRRGRLSRMLAFLHLERGES